MNVQTDGTSTASWSFDSVSQMVSHVDAFDRSEVGQTLRGDAHNNPALHSWDLGAGYEGTKRLALTGGWPEGGAKISRGVASLPDTGNAPRRRKRRTYAGSRPHVPAYIAGAPKAMIRTIEDEDPRRKKTPFVRITFCLQRAGGADSEEILNLGVAMVGIADAIEASGRRVEIMSRYTYSRSVSGDLTLTVKAATDPLNVNALALALCHPGMSRRMLFRLQESPGEIYARRVDGDGYCRDNGAWHKSEPEGTVVIPYLLPDHELRSPQRALQWIAGEVRKATGLEVDVGQGK